MSLDFLCSYSFNRILWIKHKNRILGISHEFSIRSTSASSNALTTFERKNYEVEINPIALLHLLAQQTSRM